MIVVVIIGILMALAIPRFFGASTKAKQSEAKMFLKHIYVFETTYAMENATYGDNGISASKGQWFSEIGVFIPISAKYTYSIVADSTAFTATAKANLDTDGTEDEWTIDEEGVLVCVVNDAIA